MTNKETSDFTFPYKPQIAYFSMEIALSSSIPSYSGGLGILAGDTIRACADQGIPFIGITLLSEKGYFIQSINEKNEQEEKPEDFDPSSQLTRIDSLSHFQLGDHQVAVQPWVKLVKGISGFEVPVVFLDTNIDENDEWERSLTSYLYGGDKRYRIGQEMVLGVGGVSVLDDLGFMDSIKKFHMNEGHASFLTLMLYKRLKNVDKVKEKCVFTTHTPVKAGIDVFNEELVSEFVSDILPSSVRDRVIDEKGLNMTVLGLVFSEYINGVAKKHRTETKKMFPGYTIDSITNGVHLLSWVSDAFQSLYDTNIPGWKTDNYSLRSAIQIPLSEIWDAHQIEKNKLMDFVKERTDNQLDESVFTIGFARRQTAYKRPDLLLYDPDELRHIHKKFPIQILYAGKAHPKDTHGKELITKILEISTELRGEIPVLFLENYDFDMAKKLVSGVDLWVNTPKKPLEASGTSGMKAALNGIPQLSILDGWWVEGHLEDITGWSIGGFASSEESDDAQDAEDLYNKLEYVILPSFYDKNDKWIQVMRYCIALNGSFFNTQRMLAQYVLNAYFL